MPESVTPNAGVPGRAGATTSPVLRESFEQVTSAEEAALDRKAKAEAFQASGGVKASRIQDIYKVNALLEQSTG